MAIPTLAPLARYVQSSRPVRNDADLLAAFALGADESAFAQLVRRHGAAVLGVCHRVLGDAHHAEDAFQATFLLLARRAGSLQRPERLAGWLHGAAHRTALKLRSHHHRRRGRELPLQGIEPPATNRHDPDLHGDLDAAIRRLPAKYREPVVMCYLEGLTHEEAGTALRCPANTVATRLARARERLRLHLTNRGLSVAVTGALVAATTRHAVALAAGAAIARPDLVTLMEGVQTAMMWNKTKLLASTVVLVLLTGVGVTQLAYRAAAETPAEPARIVAAPPVQRVNSEHLIPATSVNDPAPTVANFVVSGVDAETRRRIAGDAERHRDEIAKLWLGKPLPNWRKPCPIAVTLNADAHSGATTFRFDTEFEMAGMRLVGPLDHVLANELPHEVTHTVLADWFRKPLPRWFDEGAAVMSESIPEQNRHDEMCRRLLNEGRAMRLSYLLKLKEYPSDVAVLYAQGHSVVRFLIARKGRAALLEFVKLGMDQDWEVATRQSYDGELIVELEAEWINWLKQPANRLPGSAVPSAPNAPPLPMPLPKYGEPAPAILPAAPAVYPTAATPPAAPVVARAPVVVQASYGSDGLVTCRFPKTTRYEPLTTVQQLADGSTQQVTSYVRRSVQEECCYALEHLRVIGTDGKAVATQELVNRLSKGATVLFVVGAHDDQLLPLLKEGTLIVSPMVETMRPFAIPPPPK